MSLSNAEIREILDILDESAWEEAEVTIGDLTLAVSKTATAPGSPAPPAPGSAPPSPSPEPPPAAPAAAGPAPAEPEPAGHLIRSPSVGVFWRSPEPGAAPFVEVGEQVSAGQTLCIVEVMKLMQHVTADVDGVITEIHVENAEHVEFDTPLFSVG
jgi:acetyl-CoA carboxylase biotin carboxyl carrier protein